MIPPDASERYSNPLWVAVMVFVILYGMILGAILVLNSGKLVFTLDDPYIHLALAENLIQGHYGVNHNEFSAPASSILWPLLLAPFSGLYISPWIILFINAAAAIGTLIVIRNILIPDFAEDSGSLYVSSGMLALLLILAIPSFNLVGLAYTGMEHSVQVFLTVVVIYGLVVEMKRKRVPWWAMTAIIAAPLIRFECLAISLPAILFLILRGHYRTSLGLSALLAVLFAGFAFFLVAMGHSPFPSSVIAKSAVIDSGGSFTSILENLHLGLVSGRGVLLATGLLVLLYTFLNKENEPARRWFAGIVALSVVLHLIFGSYGWYSRYEIYIWTALLVTLFSLHKPRLYNLFEKLGTFRAFVLMITACILLCAPYFITLLTTPLASNNIYEQQYQMHRFVTEYYDGPVAVNDLGYVSYGNDNYVLDLWGLASPEALNLREKDGSLERMDMLLKNRNIRLAMIYDNWFEHIPGRWILLGTLSLGKMRVTPAEATVSFYATRKGDCDELIARLADFQTTLPDGVRFNMAENNCKAD